MNITRLVIVLLLCFDAICSNWNTEFYFKDAPALESKNVLVFNAKTRSVILGKDLNLMSCNLKMTHTNSNNVTFGCVVIDDDPSKKARDLDKIFEWLEQFYEYKAIKRGEFLCSIPVLYSDDCKGIAVSSDTDVFILLSNKKPKKIYKTIRYRTILGAPISAEKNVCFVNISTSFSRNLKTDFAIGVDIEKGNALNVFRDSFHYIVFGNTR